MAKKKKIKVIADPNAPVGTAYYIPQMPSIVDALQYSGSAPTTFSVQNNIVTRSGYIQYNYSLDLNTINITRKYKGISKVIYVEENIWTKSIEVELFRWEY